MTWMSSEAYIPRPPSPLEDRHLRLIEAAAHGRRTEQIAADCNYSPRSVDGIIQDGIRRVGARNRPALVAFAIRRGLVRPLESRRLSALSRRQLEVAQGVADGETASEIAARLGIAERTVRAHMVAARAAGGCATNSALAALVASREFQTGVRSEMEGDPTDVLSALESARMGRAVEWLQEVKHARAASDGRVQMTPHRRPAERLTSSATTLDMSTRLLAPTATTPERVEGLEALGLAAEQIAIATGVSPSTVRNWRRGVGDPRPGAAAALDDLRMVAKVLLEGGLAPDRISLWLASRDVRTRQRPLDQIGLEPTQVLAAALAELSEFQRRMDRDGEPGAGSSFLERRVMDLMAKGLATQQIAEGLDIPEAHAQRLTARLRRRVSGESLR
jgi:DNA-binding NarL/FixJ family response regulator/DNA-binding transcriptional regulator YiaG